MEKAKIDRINQLAKKSKEEGLTEEEKQEQKQLRDEYITIFRASLVSQLDNIYVVDENGKENKLLKKDSEKKN